ncbi:unnamed protein product, partial [Discosporangium mesarthrocarpum]
MPHDITDKVDVGEYEVVCPNTILGCDHSCNRHDLSKHMQTCRFTGPDRKEEEAERYRSLQMVLEQAELERARRVAHDAKGDWQSDSQALKARQFLHRLLGDQTKTALILLHHEILDFVQRCQEEQERRREGMEMILRQVEEAVTLLWPDAVAIPYGSWASGLMTPGSDLDIVVCLRSHDRSNSPPKHRYHCTPTSTVQKLRKKKMAGLGSPGASPAPGHAEPPPCPSGLGAANVSNVVVDAPADAGDAGGAAVDPGDAGNDATVFVAADTTVATNLAAHGGTGLGSGSAVSPGAESPAMGVERVKAAVLGVPDGVSVRVWANTSPAEVASSSTAMVCCICSGPGGGACDCVSGVG